MNFNNIFQIALEPNGILFSLNQSEKYWIQFDVGRFNKNQNLMYLYAVWFYETFSKRWNHLVRETEILLTNKFNYVEEYFVHAENSILILVTSNQNWIVITVSRLLKNQTESCFMPNQSETSNCKRNMVQVNIYFLKYEWKFSQENLQFKFGLINQNSEENSILYFVFRCSAPKIKFLFARFDKKILET